MKPADNQAGDQVDQVDQAGPDQVKPSAEQAADLAQLEAGAADQVAPRAIGPAAGAGEQRQQLPEPSPQAMQLAATVMAVARPISGALAPGLRLAPQDLTEAMWEPVMPAVARLLDHFGVAKPETAGPWAGLAIAILPLAGVAIAYAPPKKDKPAGDQVERLAPVDLVAAPVAPAVQGSDRVVIGAPA